VKSSNPIPVLCLVLAAAGPLHPQAAPQGVNPDAAIIQGFQKRVGEYDKLRKAAEGKLPRLKRTPSQAKIAHHQRELAHKIREARERAKQGDIFTPEISSEFKRLIAIAMQGRDATRVKQSLKSAEPVNLQLRVNDAYPTHVPLQSTPPTLLLNLPDLPAELDYRPVGHDLVLHDAKANLIVDFIPNAIP